MSEPMCFRCKHHDICKYRDEVEEAEKKIYSINHALSVLNPARVIIACEHMEQDCIIKREISNDCSITLL